jgi:SAM-dependent methyltransferase
MGFLKDVVVHRARNALRASLLRSAAVWEQTVKGSVDDARVEHEFTANCEICGAYAAPHTLIGPVEPTSGVRPPTGVEYRLVRCEGCDVVYLDPPPSEAELKLLYEGSVQFDGARYQTDADRITATYARRIRHHRLLDSANDSVLEVGAGLAWICRVAKNRNPATLTVAQDVSAECAKRCPWVDDYVVGPLEALSPDRQFGLVSMTHVLEHVPHPRAFLSKVAAYVASGGSIYVTAPFRPPFWKPQHGHLPWLRYEYLHVPAHISYLSERWMRQAAKDAGLTLIHWDHSHDGHQVFETVLKMR